MIPSRLLTNRLCTARVSPLTNADVAGTVREVDGVSAVQLKTGTD